MTPKTLDDVMRRILNDPDIFGPPYDSKGKSSIPVLFDRENWQKLKSYFDKGEEDKFYSLIDKILKEIKESEKAAKDWRKKQVDKVLIRGDYLKRAYQNKPYLIRQLFATMDSFGLIECKLPNMEDCGKVVENHDRAIVEQFFLSKIGKAKPHEKRALRKTLEYLKELYAMNLDVLEIAFFIRKINSLTQFVEVIHD